ncbi:MAG: hypothetical protein WC708_00015 [Lentisphaeria bacterium]|jgi:hypothetical protein
MTGDTPTCENIVCLREDGKETLCGEPATHAGVNIKDNVIVYHCDRHRHCHTDSIFVPYFTEMTLEEAILIEVLNG